MRTFALKVLLVLFTFQYTSQSLVAAPAKKVIKLGLVNKVSGQRDETTIYLDYGITPEYNYYEDAKKIFSQLAYLPQLFSLTSDSFKCSINGYGSFGNTTIIGIGYKIDSAGSYIMPANLLDNFDVTTIIRLEDRLLGTFHDLRQSPYTFSLQQPEVSTDRFFIHVSYPAQIASVDAQCENNEGIIAVDQDTSIRWAICQLYDSADVLITEYTNVTGQYFFMGLPAGIYKLLFVYDDYVAERRAEVIGHYLQLSLSLQNQTVSVGEEVLFNSNSDNANAFYWDFGDSTWITGVANPTMVYYTPGTFTVTAHFSNSYGCEEYATITITVTEATGISEVSENTYNIYAEQKNVFLYANRFSQPVNYAVSSINGQVVSSGVMRENRTQLDLSNQPDGLFVVTVYEGKNAFTKKVFLR